MRVLILLVCSFVLGCIKRPCNDRPYQTFAESDIVCQGCSIEEVANYSLGIRAAAETLIEYVGGDDLIPETSPVTLHVTEDATCSRTYADEAGYTAYYDYTCGNICLLRDPQRLKNCVDCPDTRDSTAWSSVIHEGLHAWFRGRVEFDYRIEEGFAQYVSYDASGILRFINANHEGISISTDPCVHITAGDTSPNVRLVVELCDLGITFDDVRTILKNLASMVEMKGSPLNMEEFEGVVSDVMGQDVRSAFRTADLLN